MNESRDLLRVLLAVTETCPVERLWQSLVDQVADAQAEVITIIVSDDTWRRAASLPFTHEISRISGTRADFTHHRAEHVRTEAADRARERLERLAEDSQVELAVEVVSEDDESRVATVVTVERDILIAPSVLENKPLFAKLASLHRRVVLVEVDND